MKKLAILILFSSIFASCSKDNPTPPVTGDPYMDLTAGSSWNYKLTDNSAGVPTESTYTLVSSSRADSTVDGIHYHPFDRTTGGSEYYAISGNDYYQLMALPADLGGQAVQNLYLKTNAAVNASWTQPPSVISVQGFPITLTVTNTIVEKGISRTVNGITYSDVIHVSTAFSASSIFGPVTGLTTNIHSYYGRTVGLIENTTQIGLDYQGIVFNVDTKLELQSATIL